ncbi:MAG TPA: Gfo/Idh/MocA family oxidoreductase [Paracoccaceae bacterium]|nr:Gfo/Idh/MocA family oxidoreductase [Paracoccaceae bacterium]
MRIALVGIGKIARDQHVPAIAASPDWELAATVSRHGSIAGIEAFGDLQTMLRARPDIGVISLCLPPAPRFAYAEAALRAGRHLMLEKPPGATLSECHALESLARANGVALFATWHAREAAGVAAARDWLAGRTLRRLRVIWKEDVRRWHPGQDWIWQPGGLGVFDPGINALSIVTAILPDPVQVVQAELSFPENRQTPIAAALRLRHPAGAEILAEFDWRQAGKPVWIIEAETNRGTLTLAEGGARTSIDGVIRQTGAEAPLGGEYPRLYAAMARLVAQRGIDFDLGPLRLVADAFTIGSRVIVAPFHENPGQG